MSLKPKELNDGYFFKQFTNIQSKISQ